MKALLSNYFPLYFGTQPPDPGTRPGKLFNILGIQVKFSTKIAKFPIITYIRLYSVKQNFPPNVRISQE